MSLPIFDSSNVFFAGSALGVAFLGSWHCAGMCGAIAALSTKPKTIALYQSGRLLSYVILGTLAAAFGAQVLGWIPDDRKWIITVVFGVLSLWVLLSTWNLDFPQKLQKFLWRHRPRGGETTEFFSLGVLNGLLPCHWLYGFLMVAAGFGSPWKGAVLLACLWAGSLPWLLGASTLSGVARRWVPKSKWPARVLLVTVVLGLILQGFMGGDPHLGCKLAF
ncbi:MAG: sulfite exporter TauE/SafE family protein [Bdellovibrionaceae bacterium]|nr:sulfite exporter TauE/SafE family protein [Pseudobdellovibrionaceae bacterium]MBX3034034.1 sulfite exporter TauE/SafE family protein [Pseudobdellovibrionaceae bacterium]